MSAEKEIQKLLTRIKAQVNQLIEKLNVNSTVKRGMKKVAAIQIDKIPDTVRKARTQKYVARLLENPMVRKNTMVQKQIGAAYWAIKTAIQDTPAKRAATVKQLIDSSCVSMSPQKKEAIADLMASQCGNYQCGAETYWDIFQKVDAACWIALLKE